jgi:hypothetical protein
MRHVEEVRRFSLHGWKKEGSEMMLRENVGKERGERKSRSWPIRKNRK